MESSGEYVAPGTGEDPAPPVEPSAETLITDTATQGPPDTVPYGRFKEVNDQLRSWKELEAMGYDPQSLRNLAEWEINFGTDPAGSWMELAERLDDLPEPVREAVRSARQQGSVPTGTHQGQSPNGEGQPTDSDEPPEWAKPLVEDYQTRKTVEQQQAQSQETQQILDQMIAQWNELDNKDGIQIPDKHKLNFIAGASGSAESIEEIIQIARKEALEMLELGRGTLQLPPKGPNPVPSGTSAPSAPPVAPKTLKEATAMARADFESGRLSR